MLSGLRRNFNSLKGNTGNNAANRFAKTWGGEAAFNKTVDRTVYEQDAGGQRHPVVELKEQYLHSCRAQLTGERSEFMARIVDHSLRYLAQRQGRRLQALKEEAAVTSSMTVLIEDIFSVLQAYSYAYNSAVGFSELRTTATRPQMVVEVLRYNKLREPVETIVNFRARLSTCLYSLVIRGHNELIEFILLPSEMVIGLSRTENAFQPLAQIRACVEGDQINWQSEERPLTRLQMEALCMELFTALITATQSEMLEEERVEPTDEDNSVSPDACACA